MPKRAIDFWLPFIDEVLALWDELGAGFKVGDITRDDCVALRTRLKETLDHINSFQAKLGLEMGERDAEIDDVEEFISKFRAAVVAQFGPNSTQANRVPKVTRRSHPTPAPTPPQKVVP